MKIIINPVIDVQYAVYYIKGLQAVFGKKNVTFARKSEMGLFVRQEKILNISFLFVENSKTTKISIDHGDFNSILDMSTYEWADIYGKVNTNWKITPKEDYPKIVCLSTNFGIKGFNFPESIYYSIRNYPLVKPANIKRYFAQYYKQRYKLALENYPLSNPVKNYVFSANTLWYSDEENKLNETTNKLRADFMDTCISMPEINFDGGFFPSQLGNNNFQHLHLKQPLTQLEYIEKLKQSVFAFNTPAVWNCHGWKLGEFLCMGKAIISTPLSNDLPEPLQHGENIHIVNNQNVLVAAILLLNKDEEYRKKLEKGARRYYEKYVSPEAAIRLLKIVNINTD